MLERLEVVAGEMGRLGDGVFGEGGRRSDGDGGLEGLFLFFRYYIVWLMSPSASLRMCVRYPVEW